MIYQFKEGSHLTGDAQAVGERLEAIRNSESGLTPEAVVADARSKKSVLHGMFEWDDAKAADKYRLGQAGHIIRCVTVVVEDLPAVSAAVEPRSIRAFVPVQIEGHEKRRYESLSVAMSDEDLRQQVLRQAHAELVAVARKHRELKELSEVVSAIDRVGQMLQTATA